MHPDPAAQTFTVKVATIRVIAEKIRNLTPLGDISLVMHQVEELALFDLSTKPNITHTDAERKKVKTKARELLTTLKSEKLGLD